MVWDEYPAIEERLLSAVEADIIQQEDSRLDDWDATQAVVRDRWEAEFEGTPESVIVDAAAPQNFRMLDCLDRAMYQPANSIREIAIIAVTEALNNRLTDDREAMTRAVRVHDRFDTLCMAGGDSAPYTTADGWPCPTQLVDAFFQWVSDQEAYVADEGNPRAKLDADTVTAVQNAGHSAFNESHVRQVSVLTPVADAVVLEALGTWIETEHEYPS